MSQPEEQFQPQPASERKRNPYTLWFVVISFLAPVIAAYALYFFGDITSFSNSGEFIQPHYNISELRLQQDGRLFTADSLDHKWLIMLVVGARCDESCQEKLINIRQIKRAVKRPPKVRYALIATAQPDDGFQRFIDEQMTDAVLLSADAGVITSRLGTGEAASPMLLSDPFGNMVMRFTHDLGPKLVIKDLNRLF